MKFTRTHKYRDIALSVTVDRDEDSCEVTRVTAADSQIDLFDLFSPSELGSIAGCIDAQLEREASKHNAEVRAERHQWHREFRVAA